MATAPKSGALGRYRVLLGTVVVGAGDDRIEVQAGAPDGGDIIELSEKDAAPLLKSETIQAVDAPAAPAEPAPAPAPAAK